MKTTILFLSLIALASSAHAAPDPYAEQVVAKTLGHVKGLLQAKPAVLEKTYAEVVILMPGHEFQKPMYKLVPASEEAVPVPVKRADLIPVILEEYKKRGPVSDAELEQFIGHLALRVEDVWNGPFVTEATDPVKTPDGKLHFSLAEGDRVVRASLEDGEFMLFQLRDNDGEWQIVAEYVE